MKKLFAILMTVCMLAGMCTVSTFAANDAVVYLKAGGTGDGSSEANAAGTLPDAMAAAVAKTTDVKIQVVGDVEFDMTENYSSPLHTNKITISGKGTNGRLLVKNPLTFTIWYLKGALAFEHLEFNLSKNHMVFNADFNDFETLQSGISNLMKGEYSIALNLFHHFEGINNHIIINLNSSIANANLILIELYYSIAKCYHKLNKLWRAEEYYRKAFRLVYTCYSEIGLDTNLDRCDILIPQTVKNIYSEVNVKDYLRSTICKITDYYIDVLHDIRDYDKAIKVIELLEIQEEQQGTCLREILHTVKISIYILQKLSDKNANKIGPVIKNNQIHLCHIANLFFELVEYSIDNDDIYGIKDRAKKVAKLLETLPDNDDYGHLSWDFSDIRQAINKRFAENKNVLLILESTLAKIENYQEITYHRRYNR